MKGKRNGEKVCERERGEKYKRECKTVTELYSRIYIIYRAKKTERARENM